MRAIIAAICLAISPCCLQAQEEMPIIAYMGVNADSPSAFILTLRLICLSRLAEVRRNMVSR